MALETSDIFPVQKTAGGPGSVRQATIGALLNLAAATSGFWQRTSTTLSPVNTGDDLTDIGDITAAGNVGCTNLQASGNGSFGADINIVAGTGEIQCTFIDGGEYATDP